MYILYSLALTLGVIVLLPRFVWDAVRHGKYVEGLSQRLGNIPSFTETLQKVVWVHCVSVGETLAARPLIEAIRLRYPSHSIIISTTTATGQEVARKMFGERRKSKRYSINRAAKFVTESGALPRDCIVTNISESGARLFSEASNVPEQFRLLIDGDTPIREECRVVWRLGGELGVVFITSEKERGRLNAIKSFQSQARSVLQNNS